MTARIQNSVSTRLGAIHTWKSKNIVVRKSLKHKYDTYQKDKIVRAVAIRNLSTKKIARIGFIPGLSIYRDKTIRKKRSFKPKVIINSAFF